MPPKPQPTQRQKEKAKNALLATSGQVSTAILVETQRVNDNLQALERRPVRIAGQVLLEGVKGDKGDTGDEPSDERLTQLILPLIPEPVKGDAGQDGKDYTITEKDYEAIAKKVKVPIVEKVIEHTETIVEKQPIVTHETKEVAVYEEPEIILQKILTYLEENKTGIDAKYIRNLPRGRNIIYGRLGASETTSSGSLSVLTATGTVNDSNVTFTFISAPKIVCVNGTNYITGHGVTISGTTATLDNPAGTGGFVYGLG